MSTAIAKNFQVGADGTATNNFTIRQPATPDGTVRIANGNTGSTTDLVTLTSAGNLGLGVTPSAWQSIRRVLQIGGNIALWGQSSGAGSLFLSNNTYYDGTNFRYLNTSGAGYYAQSTDGSHSWHTAPSGTAGNAISFTQAMTLDASGRLGVGTTSPQYRLHAFSSTAAEVALLESTVLNSDNVQLRFKGFSGERWAIGNNVATGGTGVNFDFYDLASSALRARIDSSGNFRPGVDNAYSCGASGFRWNAVWAAIGTIQTSDEREKTEIVDSPLGLDFINSLRPVAYKFKVGGNVVSTDEEGNEVITPVPGKRQHFGLLAQQVKQALGDTDFGGWILTDPNDAESEQGLRYDEFISPLVKAIQEQQAIITALTARVEALEAAKV